MRDRFSEFYPPTDEEVARYITEGIVVPDTNVLLGLYRLTSEERDQVLEALGRAQDRLWLPYQVGLEYQRNRLGVIRGQASAYERLKALHGARTTEELGATLDKLLLPEDVIGQVRPLLGALAEALRNAVEDFEIKADAIAARHVVTISQGLSADPVRQRLDDLFAGRIGEPPSSVERAKRIKEGIRRLDEAIPPGYKDSKKDTDELRAGDYLVWAELLDHAADVSEQNSPVLFVTDDVKEDWFERSGGEPVGPLPALVREFATRNQHGYHQVTLADFLKLAKSHLQADVDTTTIERTAALRGTGTQALLEFLAANRPIIDPTAGSGAFVSRLDSEMFRNLMSSGIDPEVFRNFMSSGIDPEVLRNVTSTGIDPKLARNLMWANPEMFPNLTSPGIPPDVIGRVARPNRDVPKESRGERAQGTGQSDDGEEESPRSVESGEQP